MKTKWDIVDDVVAPLAEDWVRSSPPRKIKSRMRNALATTVFAGTLALPSFAVSVPVMIAQEHVCASDATQTGFMKMQSEFVRPRGNRSENAQAAIDTPVGLSTRRLAELHTKLFRADDSEDVELAGEYSFL